MRNTFKIGDLVYVEGFAKDGSLEGVHSRPVHINVSLAVVLKVHTKANPDEVFYRLHLMEKNKEEWVSGVYLQPTH